MIETRYGTDFGAIFASRRWQNESAQVIARSYLRELDLSDAARWNYDSSWLTRKGALLQLGATSLLPPDLGMFQFVTLGRYWEAAADLPSTSDKVGFALLAAIAYEIGGSPANGAAVLNKFNKELEREDSFLLRTLVLLLRRRLMRLRESLAERNLVRTKQSDPLSLTVVGAIEDFSEYLLSGNSNLIASANAALDDAIEFASASGAVREHTIASALRRLTGVINQRSIWTVLKPVRPESQLWTQYLRLLARGQSNDILDGHSITELWPSQRKALESGVLDSTKSSIVVRMPTSSGKTRVAEMAIVHTLVEFSQSKAIYVAPYKALANELLGTFRRLLGDLGFAVASSVGAYDFDDQEEELIADADLIILTPERLDLLLRLHTPALEAVRIVILDEGHILEDASRGAKVELLFTRLRTLLPNSRFLVASAVVSERNLVDLAEWLKGRTASAQGVTAKTDWRPSLQKLATFRWRGDRGRLEFYDPMATADRVETFLPNVVTRRDIEYTAQKTQRRRVWHFGGEKGEIAAELALRLSKLGPVLIYVVQPLWTIAVARVIERLVEADPDLRPTWWGNVGVNGPSRSERLAKDWSADEELGLLFSKGIAIHHGDMPEALREAVERDARERRFRIIVATGTLSSGVNIPIRSVVFHSSTRYDEKTNQVKLIPAADYWNIAGRAGRAGLETEGLVVHIITSTVDENAFENFMRFPREGSELVSRLLFASLRLDRNPSLRGEVEGFLDPEVLAIAAEESSLADTEATIDELLEHSLAQQQARRANRSLDSIRNAMKGRAGYIFERLPLIESRLVFAQTGLPSDVCIQIAANLEAHPEVVAVLLEGRRSESMAAVMQVIADVGAMQEIGVPYEQLLDALGFWLEGSEVGPVVAAMRAEDVDGSSARKIVDRYFRYYLPWYASSAIRIAAYVYGVDIKAFSPVTRMLPAIVRYGLPTTSACFAMSVGVPTRAAAIKIGDAFDVERPEASFAEFRNWLASIPSSDFLERFDLEGGLLNDVAESLTALRRDEDVLDSLRNDEVFPRTVIIEILKSRDAERCARSIQIGSQVDVRRTFENVLDRNGIEIRFEDYTVGIPGPGDAMLLASALDTGVMLGGKVMEVNRERRYLKVCIEEAAAAVP